MYCDVVTLALLLNIVIIRQVISHFVPCSRSLIAQSPTLPPESTGLKIIMLLNNSATYFPQQNVTVYENSTLTPQFAIPVDTYTCANTEVFTMNQTNQQFENNTQYYLIFQNLLTPLQVNLTAKYSNFPIPTPNYTVCFPPACIFTLVNNCQPSNDHDYNAITVTISNWNNTLITQFQYNFVCQASTFYRRLPIRWGILVVIIVSIFIIFISSKFQQAVSYSNICLYINYPLILFYCLGMTLNFFLIFFQVGMYVIVLEYSILAMSILISILSVMVCFSQLAYRIRVLRCCRFGYFHGKFRIRVMDVLGFLLGVGVISVWFFTGRKWMASDVIFIFIYISTIKLVKFGSLKIGFINFISSLILGIIFIALIVVFNKASLFEIVYISANPLYIISPIISKIPNITCVWYSIFQMAYPGMFLAYLQRFDQNRSSKVYATIFIICYVICTIIWFIADSLFPFELPFQLFTVPISMIIIVLFANRRGELQDIWTGRFFDQQKSYYENQQQMIENLRREKSPSTFTYEKEMFTSLKYMQNDNMSRYSRSSKSSNFSQVVAQALHGYRNTQLTETKHLYSDGNVRQTQSQRPLESMQTNLVSSNEGKQKQKSVSQKKVGSKQ